MLVAFFFASSCHQYKLCPKLLTFQLMIICTLMSVCAHVCVCCRLHRGMARPPRGVGHLAGVPRPPQGTAQGSGAHRTLEHMFQVSARPQHSIFRTDTPSPAVCCHLQRKSSTAASVNVCAVTMQGCSVLS
jgi:hypothetical protein